jgi:predicted kinase
MRNLDNILYIFSGLPGTGKTTIAKNIAKMIGAVYIRIDTIEQGIRDLCNFNVQGEGYRLAYRIIKDNLIIGNSVVVDSCNPIKLTRNEYENTAAENNCEYVNIEIICSDKDEHKKRIETRENDIKNLKLPAWKEVIKRDYEPWEKEHIIIDTAHKDIETCVDELRNLLIFYNDRKS